jgi:hypothetical protein
MGRQCRINGSGKKFIQVLVGMPKANRLLEYVSLDVRIIFKWSLEKIIMAMWIGFMWLKRVTYGFHKILKFPWVAAQLLASVEGFIFGC